jgi:uncharacterized protein involved in exopolysaccharide biosynthesis
MEEASEINKETWNKKRVFLGIFLLVLLIIGGGYLFRDKIFISSSRQLKSVEGASTSTVDTAANVQETVKEKIDNLKQEVSGLNLMEVASSSSQVQKILNDIKALQQYPANQIKDLCRKICGL